MKVITLKWPVVVLELVCVFLFVDIDLRVYPYIASVKKVAVNLKTCSLIITGIFVFVLMIATQVKTRYDRSVTDCDVK